MIRLAEGVPPWPTHKVPTAPKDFNVGECEAKRLMSRIGAQVARRSPMTLKNYIVAEMFFSSFHPRNEAFNPFVLNKQ